MATAFCWSLLAILLKYSLNYASPQFIVWFRLSFAFISFLFIYIILSKQKKSDIKKLFKPKPLNIIIGVLLGINYIGFMQGLAETSPSNAQVLIQSAPLLLAILGILFLGETFRKKQLFGFVLTIIGFVIFFNHQLEHFEFSKYINGNLWILLAAVSWALYGLGQKKVSAHTNLNYINVIVFFFAALTVAPFSDFTFITTLSLNALLFLCLLGLNTVVAYFCLGYAIKTIPVSHVSPIITLNPILTLVFLKIMDIYNINYIPIEPIGFFGYIGALLVVLGVILVISTKKKAP